jgi:hypothetical protein
MLYRVTTINGKVDSKTECLFSFIMQYRVTPILLFGETYTNHESFLFLIRPAPEGHHGNNRLDREVSYQVT